LLRDHTRQRRQEGNGKHEGHGEREEVTRPRPASRREPQQNNTQENEL
jgi:hypothetical protein